MTPTTTPCSSHRLQPNFFTMKSILFGSVLALFLLPGTHAALVESGMWDTTSCSGNPHHIDRSDSASVTDCQQYASAGCKPLAPGFGQPSTFGLKYMCPASMTEEMKLITDAGTYVQLDVYNMSSNCAGAMIDRQWFLADDKCRRSGDKYVKTSCSGGEAKVVQCSDTACSQNCDQTLGGTLNTCIGTVYKYSCPVFAAGGKMITSGSTTLPVSSIAIMMTALNAALMMIM